VDPEENAARGKPEWRRSYQAQRAHRHDQIERMTSFAAGRGCRMLHLVSHFGDQHDSGEACGICDHCAPEDCLATSFRGPKGAEMEVLAGVLDLLQERDGLTSGQLHQQAAKGAGFERKTFESLLDGLVRSGLVEMLSDSFEKDGRTIHFQRAWLTRRGRLAGGNDVVDIQVVKEIAAPPRKRRTKAKSAAKVIAKEQAPLDSIGEALFEKLREWRLKEARRRRVPAFRILTDRTLADICRARPADQEELLDVPGIGPALARKFGGKILGVIGAESNGDTDT
jgi:DNA topoisomerase-3